MRRVHHNVPTLLAALMMAGCWGDDGTTAPTTSQRPDPVVNEQTTHTQIYTDEAVPVERVSYFRTTDVLPDLDVRRLQLVAGAIYAGTATGLARLNGSGDAFEAVAISGGGAVVDLAVTATGELLIARADEVQTLDAAGTPDQIWPLPGEEVTAIAAHGSDIYIGNGNGLSQLVAGVLTPVAAAQGFAVRDLVVSGDVIWIATAAGLRRYDTAADAMLPDLVAPGHLADDDVRALAVDDGGDVHAATASGRARIDADGGGADIVIPQPDSDLPNADLRAIDARGGVVLSGHGIGATAVGNGHKDHYHSLRWVLDETLADVLLDDDGSRWLATASGVTRIAYVPATLAEVAADNEARLPLHWRMDGFVDTDPTLVDEWDAGAGVDHHDKDNDGLWTQMVVATWCFAYATTGDEQYYENARKAMDVMQLLFDVPAVTFGANGMDTGFITRSLVRSDEGAIFDDKATQDNWHLEQHQGNTYYWKDDTSSDEYDGHFFGIPLFYDLCAKTEDEKEELRTRVHRSLSYIIDNGYLLIDLDGAPTTHGHWANLAGAVDSLQDCIVAAAPEDNSYCFESFGGGGWLNSIQILGWLLAGWHMTGDDRFYDEYERLAIVERYAEMIPIRDSYATVTTKGLGNHSDHELASLAYFTLLRYEPNADRREIWKQSLKDMYGYEIAERNPLEIAVMASAMEDADAPVAAGTLLELPYDWRNWLYDNSHRLDAERDTNDRHDHEQFDRVFPYNELRTMLWNGNPYAVSGGGNGKVITATWPYLLPYWMMRYYGAIQ